MGLSVQKVPRRPNRRAEGFSDARQDPAHVAEICRTQPDDPPTSRDEPLVTTIVPSDLEIVEVVGALVLDDQLVLRPREIHLPQELATGQNDELGNRRRETPADTRDAHP